MKQETLSALGEAKAYHLEAANACEQAIDAAALGKSIAAKQEEAAKLDAQISNLTQSLEQLRTTLGEVGNHLDQQRAACSELELKFGAGFRYDELGAKIAEREAALRKLNRDWDRLVKTIDGVHVPA